MAIFHEHTTSEDGDVVAPDRMEATRTIVVQCAPREDPIVATMARYREGTQHPKRDKFPGMVLQSYTQRRTENPLVWLVDLLYDFPDRLGFTGWRLSVDYGEETVRRYRDLRGRIVGAHGYTAVEASRPAPWSAATLTGTTKLLQAEDNVRRREGMDVYRNATMLVLERTLQYMTAPRIAQVEDYKHHYNAERFIAWQPGELLFRRAVIREEPGPPAGDRSLRALVPLIYPVELHFSVRKASDDEPDGWPTLRFVDTWRDSHGNEAVIQFTPHDGTPGPVSTLYDRYEPANMHDLISILEGGSVTAGRGL